MLVRRFRFFKPDFSTEVQISPRRFRFWKLGFNFWNFYLGFIFNFRIYSYKIDSPTEVHISPRRFRFWKQNACTEVHICSDSGNQILPPNSSTEVQILHGGQDFPTEVQILETGLQFLEFLFKLYI